MYVKNNPIPLLILYYQLDRNKICQDLNITMDYLYYLESDGIDLPDPFIIYFCLKCNENKTVFMY